MDVDLQNFTSSSIILAKGILNLKTNIICSFDFRTP